jgi:putative hydrolase
MFMRILQLCKEYSVPVLASSDAHFCTLVGNLERSKTLIQAAGLDESQVLNTSVDLFLSAIKSRKLS